MGWILRTKDDVNNPTLPGGVYGKYITIGRPVYYRWDGSQTRGIILISDGGLYGLDSIDTFEYKGAPLTETTEWIFHRGTFTKQIVPLEIESINTGTDVVTLTGHPFANGDLVRFGAVDGDLPAALSRDLKYQISDDAANTFKVKDAAGSSYIDFTDAGTGTLLVWKADAGFDDPVQGLPTFCPEVETTFSNIAYVEFKLPTNRSSASDPPDWEDFRIVGTGRRLMDYDNAGIEQGVVSGDPTLLANVALEIADNWLVNYKGRASRIDWPSWFALREAGNVEIWQRVQIRPDDTEIQPTTNAGFTGKYYASDGTGIFGALLLSRLDPTINFSVTSDSWVSGVTAPFAVRWTGRLKAKFSELTTFTLAHNDGVRFWINGNLIIDYWNTNGTHTGTFNLVQDEYYDVILEYWQNTGAGDVSLKWSSTSLPIEIIPSANVQVTDGPVHRYECHMAFGSPAEASEVHERLMERCPGWDWTDDDGLIKFLSPSRPIAFAFTFDRMDDDSLANFVKQTFVKKRRPLSDRRNFLLFRYRNVQYTGFPAAYIQADREELRDLAGGVPTNDPASDIGVATLSLAERIAEFQMVLKSDPEYTANISGGRASSKIRKNQLVSASYYDIDGNYVVDEVFLVTFHAWGSTAGQNDFALLPISVPFYTDELYIAPLLLHGIDAGRASGGTVANWAQDNWFTGGSTGNTADAITLTGVDRPAPQAVYQTRRYGSFSYTFTNLEANVAHIVRLHFAEIVATSNGSRIFDVLIQGSIVVNDLDIHALVGHDHALVYEFNILSDNDGEIAVTFTAGTGDPQINGIEVYEYVPPQPINVALATNGATITASSSRFPWSLAKLINGVRHTNNAWLTGEGWAGVSNNISLSSEWIEIDFGVDRAITEIDIITLPDAYNFAVDPTLTDTFTLYGIQDFTTQYWNGSSWVNINVVTANNKVWRQFTFASITTRKIRVLLTDAPDGVARLVEIEAWGN